MFTVSTVLPTRLFQIVTLMLAGLVLSAGLMAERLDPENPDPDKDPMEPVARELRGAWIATVGNMDWPSEPGLSVEEQKAELIELLDRAAIMNMNSIILQVRPAGDALYDSPYEPWSSYLTGEMGKAPEPYYDPLEFAVEEAHKRGLELHAWLNPYRVLVGRTVPSDDHISITNPEYIIEHGNYLWMDPSLPEVQDLSLKVMLDVVNRYDIDGLHLDDYYYPYGAGGDGFADTLSWNRAVEEGTALSRGDWRRQNVNQFIERLYNEVKEAKPHVKVGISPIGYWYPGYPAGTHGFDAYNSIYADSRLWLREGWLDYFVPQLYTDTAFKARNFPEMLRWWEEQNWQNRHVYAGLISRPAEDILTQVFIARAQRGITGSVYFRMQNYATNRMGQSGMLSSTAYATPALLPTAPWLGDTPPDVPDASLEVNEDELVINVAPSNGDDVRWWVVRSRTDKNFTDNLYTENNFWETEVLPGTERRIVFSGSEGTVWPDDIIVSAVDRLGNESEGAELRRTEENNAVDEVALVRPDIIEREHWGLEATGHFANAARRNMADGDTLRFRELTVVLNGINGDDTVNATLSRHSVTENIEITEESAFNWHGYHIRLLGVNKEGNALADFEIGTTSSLAIPRFGSLLPSSITETGSASQRLRVPHSIKNITIHQTIRSVPLATNVSNSDLFTEVYNYSLEEKNYWDIPYHYIVGLDGTIYEGRDSRFAGESSTSFNPQGHLIISVLGNFHQHELTTEQTEAVADLVAWSSEKYDVPVDRIYSEGDWAGNGTNGFSSEAHMDTSMLQGVIRARLTE